ncbi:unnamed protein product [Caretta caretta]|nr:uncharacterized protein LOC125630234 isoform X5 [Caretta caretta]
MERTSGAGLLAAGPPADSLQGRRAGGVNQAPHRAGEGGGASPLGLQSLLNQLFALSDKHLHGITGGICRVISTALCGELNCHGKIDQWMLFNQERGTEESLSVKTEAKEES